MRLFWITLLMVIILAATGFASYSLPQYAGVITEVNVPKLITDSSEQTLRSAEGAYFSFLKPLSIIPFFRGIDLWIFSVGDGSIESTAAQANIKQIHHVDENTTNFWLLWDWFQIKNYKVYGS